jgi:hypothetical protein
MHIFEKAGVHDRFELALQARTRLNLSLDDEGPTTGPGEGKSNRPSPFGWPSDRNLV